LIRRIRATFAAFPRQFWMIAFGVLVTLLLFRPTGILGERLGREA